MERPDRHVPMGDFASNYGDAAMNRHSPDLMHEGPFTSAPKAGETPRTLDSETLFKATASCGSCMATPATG